MKNGLLNFLGVTGHCSAFISLRLTSLLSVSKYKEAELAGILIGKSDNTIIEWQEEFYENNDAVIDHKHGRYRHSGVLWNCESLSEKVAQHIQEKASVKGATNLTCLCFSVNGLMNNYYPMQY